MTQLTLFDSPTLAPATLAPATLAPATLAPATLAPATSVMAPAVAPVLPENGTLATDNDEQLASVELSGGRFAERTAEHQPGLNHMGDLARLVILRYQLVAKRRAEKARRG